MSLVLAAQPWPTNAELIRDIAKLGIISIDVPLLDVTYERGIWWQLWRPHDLTALNRPIDGTDFRNLAYPDNSWMQVAYDPPYAAQGSKTTTTMSEYNGRYGRDVVASDPESVQDLINDGLTEMWRITAPGGIVLCKSMEYVWNAEIWLGTHWTLTHALSLGFMVEERFEMISTTASPQPKRSICLRCAAPIQRRHDHETWTDLVRSTTESTVCRRPHPFLPHRPTPGYSGQDHASRNFSTMLCLRKPTGRRPKQYLRAGGDPAELLAPRLF